MKASTVAWARVQPWRASAGRKQEVLVSDLSGRRVKFLCRILESCREILTPPAGIRNFFASFGPVPRLRFPADSLRERD